MTLAPPWQQELSRAVVQTERGPNLSLEPITAQRFLQEIRGAMERMAAGGRQPVLLCPGRIRLAVRRFTEASLPSLVVLSYNEIIPSVEVVARETVEGAAV